MTLIYLGNYIKYEGDEFDEEEMLEWLTDPNTMAVSDQIEKVNRKMFEKLKSRNDNLVVFFCKSYFLKKPYFFFAYFLKFHLGSWEVCF